MKKRSRDFSNWLEARRAGGSDTEIGRESANERFEKLLDRLSMEQLLELAEILPGLIVQAKRSTLKVVQGKKDPDTLKGKSTL